MNELFIRGKHLEANIWKKIAAFKTALSLDNHDSRKALLQVRSTSLAQKNRSILIIARSSR